MIYSINRKIELLIYLVRNKHKSLEREGEREITRKIKERRKIEKNREIHI